MSWCRYGIWFPESSGVEMASGALAICATCQVIDSCRAYAVDNVGEVGIWGGLTDRQRRRQRVGQST